MFGVLKPALGHVSAECKKLYTSTYCNLCAALSASGAGVWNRFFLVNDVVTIDWLLSETSEIDHQFACYNCIKGGVIGKKNKISDHQRFLAAVSSYVCGIKMNDNLADDPRLKNKSLAMLFRPIMKKAEQTLSEFNVLRPLQTFQSMDRQNEIEQVGQLDKASEPTEKCYELLTMEGAKYNASIPKKTIALLGQYLGRSVYLLDAISDMAEDKKKNQYNVLNIMSRSNDNIQQVIGDCINFLKPLRIEINHKLSSLPGTINHLITKKKWNSIMASIDQQLFKQLKPLNCVELLSHFVSCSTIENTCAKCASSWSFVMVCCCPCSSCCCPCCSCCC